MNTHPPAKTPHAGTQYSLKYSREVVDQFLDSYARATIGIARILGIPPKDFVDSLVNLFAFNNQRFKVIRETIKYVDKHQLIPEIIKYGFAERIEYFKEIRSIIEDAMLDQQMLL